MALLKRWFCLDTFLNLYILNHRKSNKIMGKGDKKTKRGKINRGTYGVRRPRIKKRQSVENKIDVNNKAKPK